MRQKDHIWSVVSHSEEQQNQSNPRLLLTLNTDLRGVSTWSRDFSRTPGKLVLFTLVVLLGSLLQDNFTAECQKLARIALVSPSLHDCVILSTNQIQNDSKWHADHSCFRALWAVFLFYFEFSLALSLSHLFSYRPLWLLTFVPYFLAITL